MIPKVEQEQASRNSLPTWETKPCQSLSTSMPIERSLSLRLRSRTTKSLRLRPLRTPTATSRRMKTPILDLWTPPLTTTLWGSQVCLLEWMPQQWAWCKWKETTHSYLTTVACPLKGEQLTISGIRRTRPCLRCHLVLIWEQICIRTLPKTSSRWLWHTLLSSGRCLSMFDGG